MYRNLLFILLNTFITLHALGGTISGNIIDDEQKPVEFCNIILHKYDDNQFINGALTNEEGRFTIENIDNGEYFIELVFLGFKTDTLSDINIEEKEIKLLENIVIQKETNLIDGVTVTVNRPVIERKADRIVYNVENSAKANGENVMDLLRLVPGVTVSGNDQIRVNGKSEVQVMINGKVEQISGDQLAALLKSIQSSNVKKIEVVSNPSAKYDASAKGGILDIQLKTSLKTGVNGSIYGNYRQNKYANTDAGTNINVNYKKLTLSTNYNFSYNNNLENHLFVRKFDKEGIIQQFYEETNDRNVWQNHYANINLNYAINDKNSISLGGDFFQFTNPHISNSELNIIDNLETGEISSYQKTLNLSDSKANNPSVHLNFKSDLDTSGSNLEIKYDYTYFTLLTNSHLNTNYLDKNLVETELPYDFKQENPFTVNLHTAQVDYYKPLKNKHSLEIGGKITWTKTYNDIQFLNLIDDIYQNDVTKSNAFRYVENINALYTIWSKEWKKGWSTNAGVRAEQTNIEQYSITLDSTTKKNYIDFFPSLFIQKNIKDKHSINLNSSRKINRPDFKDLNPFQYYNSPYSIWTGNSNLQPEYTIVSEFTYTFDNAYSFLIGFENNRNGYTYLAYQNDSTKISTYKATNFKVRNNLNISVNINKDLFKWWTISYNLQYSFFKYDAVVNDQIYNLSSHKGDFNFDNTFILPKDFKINIFAFVTTPFLDATDVMRPKGMVNASISKAFLDKKLRVRISGNDIFNTMNFSFDTKFANIDSYSRNKWQSRSFVLSLSYNFQKGKQFQNARIEKSNAEEQNRIN